jgi:hypothetical protein
VLVRVVEVSEGTPIQVRFLSSVGEWTAKWMGNSPPEAIEQHVELSLEKEPTWGQDLLLGGDPQIENAVDGTIEVCDEHGTVIRLAPDGLLIFNPLGVAPEGTDTGTRVRLLAPALELWPVNY